MLAAKSDQSASQHTTKRAPFGGLKASGQGQWDNLFGKSEADGEKGEKDGDARAEMRSRGATATKRAQARKERDHC